MNKIKYRAQILLTVLFLLIISCNDNNDTVNNQQQVPQGPDEQSFENWGSWRLDQGQMGYAERKTGTGFMPTNGSWYLNMSATPTNNWYYSYISVYQESVDFSKSTKIIFDYFFSSPTVNGIINIFFTSNGTDTLWNITGINSIQKLNDTINLPSFPDKGKLTIKLESSGGNMGNNAVAFDIDNIRVE